MRYCIALFIFLFFISGLSFCYEQIKPQKKEVVEKRAPAVNFTWGNDTKAEKKPKTTKRVSSSRTASTKPAKSKKVDVKPAKESPQWMQNIKTDFRKIFLFEE